MVPLTPATPPEGADLVPEVRFPTLDTPMTIRSSPRGGIVAELRWSDLSPARAPEGAPEVPGPAEAPEAARADAPALPETTGTALGGPPARSWQLSPEIRLPEGPARSVTPTAVKAGVLRLAPATTTPVPIAQDAPTVPVVQVEHAPPRVQVAPTVAVVQVAYAPPRVQAAPTVAVVQVEVTEDVPSVTTVDVNIEDAWFETMPTSTDAEDHRTAAKSAAERGLYADAVSLWGMVLARMPDDLEGRVGRGGALQELGDFQAAAEDLAYAVALAPGAFAPALALADLNFFRKDYEESIVRYDTVLSIDPGHAMALCRRGLARFHLRDWRSAAVDLEAARATDPTIPQIDTYIRLARQGLKDR
jgi:hypothetical protein